MLNAFPGGNLFTPGVCHDIRQAVLHSPVVKSAIEQSVATSRNLSVPQVKAEVIKILTQMNAEPQEQILRSMTYSVQKILKRLYRYVTIIDSQLDMVRFFEKGSRGCLKRAISNSSLLVFLFHSPTQSQSNSHP